MSINNQSNESLKLYIGRIKFGYSTHNYIKVSLLLWKQKCILGYRAFALVYANIKPQRNKMQKIN